VANTTASDAGPGALPGVMTAALYAPTQSPATTDRASRHASVTLALTLPGDTVLYLLLPLYADTFGVSLPEAGLLLAANRLVRIAGYGWVARGYERFGPRRACLLATLGSAGATLGYAVLPGVGLLLVAR
jgi:MFS transporter, DHA1 family, inner membrane transport protein